MLRLVLLSLAVVAGSAMVCMPDMCSRVRCQAVTEESCSGGRFVKNGGYCGCCDVCILSLAEGDNCFSSLQLGVPSSTECAKGLVCDPQTMTCKKVEDVILRSKKQVHTKAQTCAERLHEIVSARENGLGPLGQFTPFCAADGSYAARQCHGSVCYCVNPMGEKIRNYQAHIGEAANMDCQCARDQHAYMQKRLIGKLFFCTNSGSYQRYQCSGSVCFCADNLGSMKPGSPIVHITNAEQLNC